MATFLARGKNPGSLTYVAGPPHPTCAHPEDDRAPISGDGYVCGHCNQLVEAPRVAVPS